MTGMYLKILFDEHFGGRGKGLTLSVKEIGENAK